MQTERRKLRKLIEGFIQINTLDGGAIETLADEIIGVFDETRPIRSYRREAAIMGIDLDGYPDDAAEIIYAVCNLWNLRPPRIGKDKIYWIETSRALQDACGEFGPEAISSYRTVFEQYMAMHQGIAPHTVSGPGSLTNVIRAHAGTMRTKKTRKTDDDGGFYG